MLGYGRWEVETKETLCFRKWSVLLELNNVLVFLRCCEAEELGFIGKVKWLGLGKRYRLRSKGYQILTQGREDAGDSGENLPGFCVLVNRIELMFAKLLSSSVGL